MSNIFIKQFFVILLIFISLSNINGQVRDRTADRKLEIYTNDAANFIFVDNEYDMPMRIVYKYSVSAISKKDGKLIAANVFTIYDCVNSKSNKVLKKYDENRHCYFQITNICIEEYYEITTCN